MIENKIFFVPEVSIGKNFVFRPCKLQRRFGGRREDVAFNVGEELAFNVLMEEVVLI